jgi:hypothetical protein
VKLPEYGLNGVETCKGDVGLFVYVEGAFVGFMHEYYSSVEMHGMNNVTM